MPFFLRPPRTTLVGPGDTVQIPRSTLQFDWVIELAVVVGRRLRHASREEATAAVAGYAVGFDLSCRDLIRVDNNLKVDLVRGKAQDTMAPCGPSLIPATFVPDPYNLRLRLWVNDELMMDASSAEKLYRIDEQFGIISEFLTIEPGDILFTGSPAGSAGARGDRSLRPGNRIRGEIEHVGTLDLTLPRRMATQAQPRGELHHRRGLRGDRRPRPDPNGSKEERDGWHEAGRAGPNGGVMRRRINPRGDRLGTGS